MGPQRGCTHQGPSTPSQGCHGVAAVGLHDLSSAGPLSVAWHPSQPQWASASFSSKSNGSCLWPLKSFLQFNFMGKNSLSCSRHPLHPHPPSGLFLYLTVYFSL